MLVLRKMLMLCGLALGFILLLQGRIYAFEATLTYTVGSISVIRGGNPVSVQIGMTIQKGDIIQTSLGSTAIISIDETTDIKVRENTSLDIEKVKDDIRVNLFSGSIFSRIIGKLRGTYSVSTETVLAGVRGTEFFIAFGKQIDDLPDVWLCVNSGSVKVEVIATGASAVIREGEGINILGGTNLTPAKRYKWTKQLNWNMDPAQGDVEDRTDLSQAYDDLLDQDYD
ncbi:MAG: hypothetical protein AMS17_15805 [Spirochaetes bacterium DG_61]|jgi:ferric-dicitrate binding protein FerR (iron transport regulator)|nr:MAG: hypothetical protein AMS17_15805 [Spirochaetes bacterium DG_61]